MSGIAKYCQGHGREAEDDVKKFEKDMREFKDNNEGKTTELKVTIFLLLVLGMGCSLGI